jgi:hypothetical protein
MMLSTLLLVPLVAIFAVAILDLPGVIVGITAITLVLGGLLRIFYALLLEEPVARMNFDSTSGHAQSGTPQFGRPEQHSALPPASADAMPAWRSRPNTAEIYQPPSVTENTTRLLNKDEKKDE